MQREPRIGLGECDSSKTIPTQRHLAPLATYWRNLNLASIGPLP